MVFPFVTRTENIYRYVLLVHVREGNKIMMTECHDVIDYSLD